MHFTILIAAVLALFAAEWSEIGGQISSGVTPDGGAVLGLILLTTALFTMVWTIFIVSFVASRVVILSRASRRIGCAFALVTFGVQLTICGWAETAGHWTSGVTGMLLVRTAVLLAPFVVMILISTVLLQIRVNQVAADSGANNDSNDRIGRIRALARPAAGALAGLMPMLVFLAVHDGAQLSLISVSPFLPYTGLADLASLLLAAGATLSIGPIILVRVRGMRSMPEGAARARLEALANRAGVRLRDIVVTEGGDEAVDARIMGIVASLRYVVLSDRLLRCLSEPDIEAIFAHELAHARLRHSTRLILLAIGLGCIALPFAVSYPLDLFSVVSIACFLVASVFLMGVVLRAFEYEADAEAVVILAEARLNAKSEGVNTQAFLTTSATATSGMRIYP